MKSRRWIFVSRCGMDQGFFFFGNPESFCRHPDKCKDSDAKVRFQEVSAAYECLLREEDDEEEPYVTEYYDEDGLDDFIAQEFFRFMYVHTSQISKNSDYKNQLLQMKEGSALSLSLIPKGLHIIIKISEITAPTYARSKLRVCKIKGAPQKRASTCEL